MNLVRLQPTDAPLTWTGGLSAELNDGLKALGLKATAAQAQRLRDYGELLLKWNRTYNLLGATSGTALVRDHMVDSLAIVQALTRWIPDRDAMLFDVGSGAGLPGLVVATMLDSLPITLVEPNGKKAAFLRQAVSHCHLSAVEVMECRIEDLQVSATSAVAATLNTPASQPVPHFICRAFTSLERFASLCRPLLQDGSLLFAMKAARVGEELAELDEWAEVLAVEPLVTVAKDVQRSLVVMQSKRTLPDQTLNSAGPNKGPASGGLLGNHSDDR